MSLRFWVVSEKGMKFTVGNLLGTLVAGALACTDDLFRGHDRAVTEIACNLARDPEVAHCTGVYCRGNCRIWHHHHRCNYLVCIHRDSPVDH